MRYAAAFLGFTLALGLAAPANAQQDRPWWASFDMGAGQLKLSTNLQQGTRDTSLTLGFAGGHRVTKWARVGLHANGWLMQAFNMNDPTVGESVGNVGGIVDVFLVKKKPLFLRVGGGVSTYSNQRFAGMDGKGPGWEVGGGYEFRIGSMGIAPTVEYAAGQLGNGIAQAVTGTGLRYSVIEFKLAYICRFGGAKR